MIVDFHSHILPRMDDGSDSMRTSLLMLRAERQQGVQRVVLTPHFYCEKESVSSFLQRRNRAFAALQAKIDRKTFPELCLGAEVAMSSALCDMDLQPLCIAGTNVLLLELPYHNRFRPREVEAIVNRNDVQIVFAHIERFYRLWDRDIFFTVMELPVYKQINCGALLHAKWWERRQLLRWIADGEIHLLGTDAHNLTNRVINMQPALHLLERKKLSAEAAEMMKRATRLTNPSIQRRKGYR
ncbi:MAG: hypothetical protein MRZ94_04765 [Oscillospiraceae bacterium]|nr:hypothetical protein [Oscillospiraceae bacterium]MDD7295289.1 hypothetical protein [Oscillospiraceae bacterium]